MSQIVLKVIPSLGRWAVVHNDVRLAVFATEAEASRAALALAVHRPNGSTAKLDLPPERGLPSEIKVF